MHPIKRAAKAHFGLVTISPWPRHSGKVSRLLMNAILIHGGLFPPSSAPSSGSAIMRSCVTRTTA